MQIRMLSRIVATAIGLALMIGLAFPQEKKGEPAEAGPEMDEMMKMWKELGTPGEAHHLLNDLVGSWETTSKVWMGGQGQDAPPMETKGTAEMKWIMGGRFLLQEAKGQMMGEPFTGMGITGYDNYKKQYVTFWIDDMGTAMYTGDGKADQSGRMLTVYGKMDEPMTGEHDKTVKYVTRIISKDKHIFEIHDLAIGEPNTKIVEITYTRNKK